MTNGEKIKEIFPDTKIITQYDNPFGDRFMVFTLNNEDMQVNIDWWNAEYKEPITKKDCNTCTHGDETDGSNCYECVKDMCNNYEPTTKNDLVVDCISRDSAIKALDYDIKFAEFKPGISEYMDDIAKLLDTIYEIQVNNLKELPSVTPQYSSELEKDSKKLEKDFGKSDCISRQAVLEQAYAYGNGLEPDGYCVNVEDIQALPSVTPQPCEDAISRQTAVEAVMQDVSDTRTHGFNAGVTRAANRIKLLPPVTPQSRKGHWIEHPHEAGACWEYSRYECSKCHDWAEDDSNFCPYCGADMRGEE